MARPPERRSVVFILSDTLRRDRLGIHGGDARTPNFDAFARENLWFVAASSQAPWTKPSVATLFTGLYPSQHGVVSHPRLRKDDGELASDVLGEERVTLAEALSAAGYQTAAFVSNPWLQSALGFAQGFEVYDDSFAANQTPGEVVSEAGLGWLAGRAGDARPFFLYLHYMDAHAPYQLISDEALERRREAIASDRRPVPPRVRAAIARRARDRRGAPLAATGVPPNLELMELVYDQGVERFDAVLGRLLARLDALPEARDAAIVLTSDHGEALFERGWGSHGHGLFEDEVGVPLAMRLPGVESDGPVECPVGLVDLRASLCDYLGVPCPGADQGRSIFAPEAPRPGAPTRVVLSEAVIGHPGYRAVREGRYKLIYRPAGRGAEGARADRRGYALFDLVEDPAETRDLLAGEPTPEAREIFQRLQQRLDSDIADLAAPAPESASLDDATRARLEALGYLGDEDSEPLEDEQPVQPELEPARRQ
jgi:arylsulfatase A-like enzyme